MDEAGLFIDVCSGGELAVALAAGVDPERLGFHGNNKSLAEIDRAVEVGIGAIVIDSLQEIDRIADGGRAARGAAERPAARQQRGARAHARVPGDGARGPEVRHRAGRTPWMPSTRIRSHPSLAFRGLHCHIGSQIFGADGFAESAARLLTLHKQLLAGGDVPELNLGGGFGIAYTSADDPAPIGELARRIAETVAAGCEELDIPVPVVAFEPGRSIIGTAGLTLYTVGTTKDVPVAFQDDGETAVRRYVSVDGGMSDNARPALYEADYSARIANRTSQAAPALVRVAGKHCESGDIVVNAEYLPGDVEPGDLLAVPATGAYCWPLSSNYNHVGRPPVVAVRDGEARVIVRGETDRRPARARRRVRPVHLRTRSTREGAQPGMIEYRNLRVALLGAGSVGSQVARLLLEQGDEFASRVGARLELVGIAVRDVDAQRDVDLPRELFTTDASSLILGADIVVELMGGVEPARGYVLEALNSGADVITANKALLATHGPELFEAAEQVGAQLYYEAAVAGAIPIIRPLRDSLAGDRINRILGIVNGTTNFVLDRMDVNGETLQDALAIATDRGYAEADPTADIGGYDAAQKAAILASLAFHTTVPLDRVYREGITSVDQGAGGCGARVRRRHQAAGHLRTPDRPGDGGGGRLRPRLPGADEPRPPARRRARRAQRGVRAVRRGGRPDVLRCRRRRSRDGVRRARRCRLGRAPPRRRRPGRRRVDALRPAGARRRPGRHALPDHAGCRGPAGRARRGRAHPERRRRQRRDRAAVGSEPHRTRRHRG